MAFLFSESGGRISCKALPDAVGETLLPFDDSAVGLEGENDVGKHMELALSAANINDVQFQEAYGYQSPGRMVLGTVQVTF